MLFFLKKLKPALVIFPTTLFVGMMLLFLTGCTAQQIAQLLEKIPDANEYQSTSEQAIEPAVQSSQDDYSDNRHQPATATIQAAPKIIFFKAAPPFVMDGGSTTLEWRTDDATSAQIIGIGTVSATGSREVTPRDQTKYELVATNDAGQSIRDEIILSPVLYKMGEPPNVVKIRAIKRFNILNPKKKIVITSQVLNKIKIQQEIKVTPAASIVGIDRRTQTISFICAKQLQGKIAWDYKGNKRWAQDTINRLCRGAENSTEPARCFSRVMHGGINWGGGTKWKWNNALDLCEGSKNSRTTISCFQQQITRRVTWKDAIQKCS